ncbi:uncharacterized protein [Symphalangus syndactylus]|uniref:uncharacterized protein n=1 Tax=Symphalangus syndactylus TaxID=9590 RepID=UPI0024416EBF|nr:uncharacterized protein LOC129465330 [Symphalangus syndactylus]
MSVGKAVKGTCKCWRDVCYFNVSEILFLVCTPCPRLRCYPGHQVRPWTPAAADPVLGAEDTRLGESNWKKSKALQRRPIKSSLFCSFFSCFCILGILLNWGETKMPRSQILQLSSCKMSNERTKVCWILYC